MPLLKGKSQETISKNVNELMHSYKKKHKIGTSHPKTAAKARKQAVAIAYNKTGKSKKKTNESYDNLVDRYLTEALGLKEEQPIK